MNPTPFFEIDSGSFSKNEPDPFAFVEGADRAPTAAQRAVQAEYDTRLDALLQRWQALREADLKNVDAQLVAAGKPAIHLPTIDEIRLEGAGEAKDLP